MAQTTVNFNLKTAGFSPFASQTLTFTLLTAGADKTDDSVVLPGTITATSAADGTGSVALFRNGDSDINSVYEVVFPNRERSKFVIPVDTATISLSHLLVDHVPSGAATQQSSVYLAAIQRANHTGTQTLSTISDADTLQVKPSEGAFANGDKTKLNGIEAGATTDQTAAEIRTLVESASDSNVFTDADHTKLNDIDADVTTLSLPASTTINDFAKASLLNGDAASVKSALGIVDATAQVNFVRRSISFTDASAFLSVTDHANLDVGTGDFSFSFAAKVSSSSNTSILQKNGSAGYALFFDNGILKLTLNASGTSDFNLATGLNDNKWHTYVVTVDRDDTAIAYVDGVAQTGVNVSGKAGDLDNTSNFQIGVVGTTPGSGIALGNYLSLHKTKLDSTAASNIYFSPDTALTAGSTQLMVDLRKVTKTFVDLSTNAFTVTTNGTIIFNEGRITALDNIPIGATTAAAITGTNITGTNVLASTTLGYTTGSGGTFDQSTGSGTGKAKTVVLNKATGQITLDGAALTANTNVAFTLTNSTIAANDILVFNHVSAGTIGAYNFNAVASSGSAVVTVRNTTSGSLSEAPVVSFAVIKAVTS